MIFFSFMLLFNLPLNYAIPKDKYLKYLEIKEKYKNYD